MKNPLKLIPLLLVVLLLSGCRPAQQPSAEVPTEAVTEPLSQCEANGHSWIDASYQAPKTCTQCGETDGEALLPELQIIESPDPNNPENTVVTHQYLEYHNGVGRIVQSEDYYYDKNGVLFQYELTRQTPYKVELEYYSEDYDENGTVIDTNQRLYDQETGNWIFHDFELNYSTSYGARTGETWPVVEYREGIFTNSHPMMEDELIEGIWQHTFLVTGNTWTYLEKHADGSLIKESYYPDGSMKSSIVTTVDEAAKTWSQLSYSYPEMGDDSAYRHETHIQFDDSCNIIELCNCITGFETDEWIEINFNEDTSCVEDMQYDEEGRMIHFYYIKDKTKVDFSFTYDNFGRLEKIGSTLWYLM